MHTFDAVLFDFDGVLLDSEPMHCACWAAVLEPLGVRLTWDFYSAHCIGIDDREMLRMMATQSDPPRVWDDLWAQYPAKKRLFQERMASNPAFHPEIRPLLAELRGDHKLAVVSSSGISEIEPLLIAGGLRAFFDTVVGGNHVKRQKPHPDPYLLAASRLGVRKPLVVEDSEAGVAAGHAAGFEVLQVKSPGEVPNLVRRVVLCS